VKDGFFHKCKFKIIVFGAWFNYRMEKNDATLSIKMACVPAMHEVTGT